MPCRDRRGAARRCGGQGPISFLGKAGVYAQSNLGGSSVPITVFGTTFTSITPGAVNYGVYGGAGVKTALSAGTDFSLSFNAANRAGPRCRGPIGPDERGLSQEELADRAGVDRSYISLLERGAYSASVDMLARLGKALGMKAAAFLALPRKRRWEVEGKTASRQKRKLAA